MGQAFYERCRSMMIEADGAEVIIAETRGEPQGLVRFSCPTGVLDLVGRMLLDFLERYPGVSVADRGDQPGGGTDRRPD